jgi:hypothetical protein
MSKPKRAAQITTQSSKPTKHLTKPLQRRSTKARAAKNAAISSTKSGTQPTGKFATLILLLRRASGASIEDLMKAAGWQAHSVRGAISGAIKKKMGLNVLSAKMDGVRIYRIVDGSAS